MTISTNILKIVPLALVLVGLLTYSFMQADWTGPTAEAPGNNTATPVNIGGQYQAKTGDLGAVRMRAGEYCDAEGTYCLNVSDVACPPGHAINSILADGTVGCIDVEPPVTPAPPTPVYSWSTGSYGSCSATSNKCGSNSGYQTRSVVCRNSQGTIVSDSNCTSKKPATQVSCSNTPCSGDR